jgi:hypothetical protein
MRKLVLLFMLAVALGSQVAFAQESQPNPKQASALAGTDSPEARTRSRPTRGEGEILEHRPCSRIRDEGFRKRCLCAF